MLISRKYKMLAFYKVLKTKPEIGRFVVWR
jgi:hypothetical protein